MENNIYGDFSDSFLNSMKEDGMISFSSIKERKINWKLVAAISVIAMCTFAYFLI